MSLLLQTELRKAFLNKWFVSSLLVMSVLGVANAFSANALFQEIYEVLAGQTMYANSEFSLVSLYGYLIITNTDLAPTEAFYLLFPIAAIMPYSWSLCKERNNGYLINIYTRTKKSTYLAAKCIATFTASFAVILVPLTLNLIASACLIPAFMPDISSLIYNGIGENRLWSSIYYTYPIAYCALFILLCAAFSGVWGLTVQTLGLFAKRPDKLLASSFVCLFCLQAFEEIAHLGLEGNSIGYLALSPLDFLRGSGVSGSSTSEMSLFVWLVGIAGTIAISVILNNKRDEL